jgi:(2Fe-2S) ferredoxin
MESMTRRPIPFRRVVFVCTNERTEGPRPSCGPRGGAELRQRLKELVNEHGLKGRLRICASGCMDVCERGPNLMTFPDSQWICGVSPDRAEEIFEELRRGIDDAATDGPR